MDNSFDIAQDRPFDGAQDRLLALLPKLSGKRVLVVGDVCLDEYLIGRAQRLSREAPVPILEFQRRFTLPGAAANPALNIHSLGSQAIVLGVIGDDEAGAALRQSFRERGMDASGLIVEPGRPTTVKTRVMAEGTLRFPQQLARLDRQERGPLRSSTEAKAGDFLKLVMASVEAVLVSDYKSGVLSEGLIQQIYSLASARNVPVTVDTQGNLEKFRRFDVVKCNQMEAEEAIRTPLSAETDFEKVSAYLKEQLVVKGVVITRGGDGISLIDENDAYHHIPATNRSEVYDVTGAGDTVIAVLTLGLAAGGTLAQACRLANYAAGIVVKRLGNATTTLEELKEALDSGADG